jgi:hypothetical protein
VGQSEDKPGFIEEALRHRQATEPPARDEVADTAEAEDAVDTAEPEALPAEMAEREPQVAEPELAPAPPPFSGWPVADRTLIDEALKKSGVIWLHTRAAPDGQGFWHVWLDDTIYLLTGGPEQPDGALSVGDVVTVVVRSKETTARLISFGAGVSDLLPQDADWSAAAAALAAGRLNLHDSPGAPDRWAEDPAIRLIRLTPSSPDGERPGNYSDVSHRAAPRPTTATTAGPKPRILHRRHGSGRPLS